MYVVIKSTFNIGNDKSETRSSKNKKNKKANKYYICKLYESFFFS